MSEREKRPYSVTTETVWSEGSRLAADIYVPEGAGPWPAILICNGWGGTRSQLEPICRFFSQYGYLVLGCDYRGWGGSDGKIVPLADTPPLLEAGRHTLNVQVLRELADPYDQTTDLHNCLGYLFSDPRVDPKRVAVWGTSFGGGHAIHVTGLEPRVRAAVGQVGSFGGETAETKPVSLKRLGDRSRALVGGAMPQDRLDALPGLLGTPDMARMLNYDPKETARHIRVPTLIIDVEDEEYFDRTKHGLAAYEVIKRNAVAKYHLLEGSHYDIYNKHYFTALGLALDWFDEHV